ncbi:MAG: SusD/RagB family nutrient-binding outer membrane lipoprotein [Balneolaceae bacterium]
MKKLSLIFSILLCILVVSCDSVNFGNVNNDDDAVTAASTEGLMAGAMNQFFTLFGRNYHTRPNLYVQYQSQVVYTNEQRYNLAPAPWGGYYVGCLSNLKQVVDITTADEVSIATKSYGDPANQAGVAEIMAAFVWKRVTDIWGPVPYTDALRKGDTLTPSYTDQETIYKDLISRVKAARDMLDPNLAGPTGDVVYGGDVAKWKKFANSFLLSLTMQLSKKYPGASGFAATEFNAALSDPAGVIEDIADDAWYQYANAPGALNPFSQLRGSDYQMSMPFTDALRGQADGSTITYSNSTYDERLNVFAADTSLNGRPYGLDKYNGSEKFTSISSVIRDPDAPLPYLTAAYTYLNRAEAAERGWTSENAQTMFTNGVMASYATVDAHWDDGDPTTGMLQSDGSAFAANRIMDAGSAGGGMMQVIDEEKWVALFPMGFQAWSEWRRTGVPGLIPSQDAVNDGSIPTRLVYPTAESGVNSESYNAGVGKLTPASDSNTSKFWWEMQ